MPSLTILVTLAISHMPRIDAKLSSAEMEEHIVLVKYVLMALVAGISPVVFGDVLLQLELYHQVKIILCYMPVNRVHVWERIQPSQH